MPRLTGQWLRRPATQDIFGVFEAAGYKVFVVGGCVRNELLGEPVSDIDMATDAHPEKALEILEDAGLKVIPTGIDHGTITVVSKGVGHEITTFRRDVETDGRHAIVAFSDRIEDDAARRDFTINAVYADRTGTVIDPQDGLIDIAARRIRFIGMARDRIREDYLRSLRFFRMHAQYADPAQGFDPEALAAIADTLDGLAGLSRERVGAEMLKLLSAADPSPAVAVMAQCGVLGLVLPGADPRALGPLVHLEDQLSLDPDPIRRLAAIADADMSGSLRLSRSQMRALETLRRMATGCSDAAELGYRLGRTQGTSACALRHALLETPLPATALEDIDRGAVAEFPISANELQPDFEGAALGAKLRELETRWIVSGFVLTRAELLG